MERTGDKYPGLFGGALAARLGQPLVLGAAWLVLWRLSALMEYAPHASIWFPPAGLSFAAFLVLGLRPMPVLLACGIIATFWSNAVYGVSQPWTQTLAAGTLFSLAHVGAYWGGAAALRRLFGHGRGERLPTLIIAFLLLATLSALAASLLGTRALTVAGILDPGSLNETWIPWWIGDMAGAIVLGPLFSGLLVRGDSVAGDRLRELGLLRTDSPASFWLGKIALVVMLLALLMVATAKFGRSELLAFAVFFLILPQMWITYTESALRVAASVAAFSVAAAVLVDLLGLMDQAMAYQFAVIVIAASSYFGLSVPVLVDQNRRLRNLVDADPLTGVDSRRHFFQRAQFELGRARRRGLPVSLVLFDIDHFKRINDEYGHTAGDRALVAVARTVRASLRGEDLVGRFGGDEFMVLLVGSGMNLAMETAERLRCDLHGIEVGDRVTLSGSFSAVEIGADERLSDAFERADARLLAAKRAGRDQLVGRDAPQA